MDVVVCCYGEKLYFSKKRPISSALLVNSYRKHRAETLTLQPVPASLEADAKMFSAQRLSTVLCLAHKPLPNRHEPPLRIVSISHYVHWQTWSFTVGTDYLLVFTETCNSLRNRMLPELLYMPSMSMPYSSTYMMQQRTKSGTILLSRRYRSSSGTPKTLFDSFDKLWLKNGWLGGVDDLAGLNAGFEVRRTLGLLPAGSASSLMAGSCIYPSAAS